MTHENIFDAIDNCYWKRVKVSELTHAEGEWMHSLMGVGKFCYFSDPPPLVREVLEEVFGPGLDYEIPYV
jgi:hypothetical protein